MASVGHDHYEIEGLELALGDAVREAKAHGRLQDRQDVVTLQGKLLAAYVGHLYECHGQATPPGRTPEGFHRDLHDCLPE